MRATTAPIVSPLLVLISVVSASGSIEVLIKSERTIEVQVKLCNGYCIDNRTKTESGRADANFALRFKLANDTVPPGENMFLTFIFKNITTNKLFEEIFLKYTSDSEWTTRLIHMQNFTITVRYRDICKIGFYGKQCGTVCKGAMHAHQTCNRYGNLKCADGWTGFDCATPNCSNCSIHGQCVAPDLCACYRGFTGLDCSNCIRRKGCVHGQCENSKPNTCSCNKDYTGEKCDIIRESLNYQRNRAISDLNICLYKGLCENGGICKFSMESRRRYICKCPDRFTGDRCEVPVIDQCLNGFICLHGGICVTTNVTKCVCNTRFTGLHCEYETHNDCSTKHCPPGRECHKISHWAVCSETTTLPANTPPTTTVEPSLVASRLLSALKLVSFFLAIGCSAFVMREICRRDAQRNDHNHNDVVRFSDLTQRHDLEPLIDNNYVRGPLPTPPNRNRPLTPDAFDFASPPPRYSVVMSEDELERAIGQPTSASQ